MSQESDIILCFECGAQNRLKAGWQGSPVCGKCCKPLPVTPRPLRASNSTKSNQSATMPAPDSGPRQKRWWLKPAFAVAALAGILGYSIWQEGNSPKKMDTPPPGQTATFSGDASNQLNTAGLTELPAGFTPEFIPQTPADSQAAFEANFKPQPAKPGILFNNSGLEGIAPFEIVTSPGANYFVKLVDFLSDEGTVGIFVRGGQRIEVNVPLGLYEMRYASGDKWYGVEHLFGPETVYSKSDQLFDFNSNGQQINGYTVELIKQASGNLKTREIGAADF